MRAQNDSFPQANSPPEPGDPAVELHGLNRPGPWRLHEPELRSVLELASVLEQRRRWRDVPATAARVTNRCTQILADLGISEEMLREIAQARAIDIDLRPDQEHSLSFPWEFAIAEATRAFRHADGSRRSLLLSRHLVTDDPTPSIPQPRSVLIIESAPGELGDHYSFLSEEKIVFSCLNVPETHKLVNPTANEIREKVVELSPSIVHLTAVDSRQGAELLQIAETAPPGVYLKSHDGVRAAPFEEIAELVTCATQKPALVMLNLYNSSLLAAIVVRRGAYAAVGFQDAIDDAVAEVFIAALYASWQPNWRLLEAFDSAWRGLSSYARELRGTGITLWSRHGMGAQIAWAPQTLGGSGSRRRRAGKPAGVAADNARAPASSTSEQPTPVAAASTFTAPRQPPVTASFTAPTNLNYSLLHNNRPLFDRFDLQFTGDIPSESCAVTVDVALNAGTETARYEGTFELSLEKPRLNLASRDSKDAIRVSLTSELARSLAESVYTSVVVHVRVNGATIKQETHRVALLAIDEWQDDDLNRQWLPSFVFPRDAAVRRVVDAAQRYLLALADDSTAGFDGYQSYDSEGASIDEQAYGVDNQVRALWWAIITEFNVGYINPPPTFTDKSQRLRTPSDTILGKRGTCIDLTLLLAACLEYVDIYPVIFLLRDHAFPGYVRTERSHELVRTAFGATTSDAGRTNERSTSQVPWVLSERHFDKVMKLVQQGHIVPIETVALTQRSGFDTAIEEGLQNLRDRRSFESLFDVRIAREASVTPLPIWGSRA